MFPTLLTPGFLITMAKTTYTAVVATDHNISIYDAESGNYKCSLFVTTGKIIGQPLVSANTITVTYNEKGDNFIGVFDAQTLNFKYSQRLS